MVLTCILRAVDLHADLLRESASDVGNDHRLGANEAPPAIISAYLGEQLEDVLAQLIDTGEAAHSLKGGKLHTGVSTLPDFAKDDSVAAPNVVLNTIVAESFSDACDVLEKAEDFDLAVHDLIKEYASKHQRIVFNGNGYSDEWVKEAERRGLPNIKTMVESIECLTYDNAVEMFEKFDVFSRAELESRAEIKYEAYSKAINIEARSMIDIASKHIIPAVIQYVTSLANSINQVKQASAAAYTGVQEELLVQSADLLKDTKEALRALETVVAEVPETEGKEQAFFFMQKVVPAMEALRKPVDELEMIVNKNMWPMPSYGDLLFEV